MKVEKHNTYIRIKIEDAADVMWIRQYLKTRLTTYTLVPSYVKGKQTWTKEIHKKFYVVLGRWYHIPVGFLDDMLDTLQKTRCEVDVTRVVYEYKPKKIKLTMNGYTPRGYQVEGMNILTTTDSAIVLNAMYTGAGKTISTFFLMEHYKTRTFIVMRPVYIKQWITELIEKTSLEKEDILHVKDGNELRSLFTKPDVEFKIVIVSNALYRNYVKEYIASVVEDDELSYDVVPFDAMAFLKVGLVVIDEVDADYHFWSNFLMTLNVNKVIALSATMVSMDETMANLFDKFTTPDARYDLFEKHPYISLFNYTYEFMKPSRVKCSLRGGYNHGVLEDYICDNVRSRKQYMQLVYNAYNIAHLNRTKKGEKCIIYFYKVDTINMFVEHIKANYPLLKPLVFIAGVSAEAIEDSDLILATAGKAGRGLDISGLATIVNTININSIQTNLQLYGRLRMPKEGESEKIAVQVGASNLKKHMEYTSNRHKMLKKKVLRTSIINSKQRL